MIPPTLAGLRPGTNRSVPAAEDLFELQILEAAPTDSECVKYKNRGRSKILGRELRGMIQDAVYASFRIVTASLGIPAPSLTPP